jgi:hypothetical protein
LGSECEHEAWGTSHIGGCPLLSPSDADTAKSPTKYPPTPNTTLTYTYERSPPPKPRAGRRRTDAPRQEEPVYFNLVTGVSTAGAFVFFVSFVVILWKKGLLVL